MRYLTCLAARFSSQADSAARYIVCLAIALIGSLESSQIMASPFIEVGEARTRHHLSYLHDTGAININLNTWPLSWPDIYRSLNNVSLANLSQSQLWSYRYIKHELSRAQQKFKTTKRIYAANSLVPFTHFSSESRTENVFLESQTALMLGRFSFNLDVQAVENREKNNNLDTQFDGSYAVGTFGNWIGGIGAIDRWWGPGWHSSLIQSNNARPSPGLFIKRKTSAPSSSILFEWMGNWSFDAFANLLENDRAVANPKMIGARFSISPFSFIELSHSRVGLWGGQNKVETIDSLLDFALMHDSRSERQTGQDTFIDYQESNQLISYDIRIKHRLKNISVSSYAQTLSNEKQSYADNEFGHMIGLDSAFTLWGAHHRIAFEAANTENTLLSDGFGQNNVKNDNALYDHRIYTTGYRYEGRTNGESAGTNATKLSLLGKHFFNNGHYFNWNISRVEANLESFSSNMYGSAIIENTLFELDYALPLTNKIQAKIGLYGLENKMAFQGNEINSGGFIEINFRL